MARAIINSEKRIIQHSPTIANFGDNATVGLATAAQLESTSNSIVAIGSVIKAVYVELWVLATGNQPGSTTVIVEKVPGPATNITAVEMADLNKYNNKKNIFYTTQGLTPSDGANPVPLIRQWIKIPKGKQRFGLNDRLQFSILALSADVEFCGLSIYKVYN